MSGCCGIDTENGQAPGGGVVSFSVTSYEVDFSAQPAAVMAVGPNSIAGYDWEYFQRGTDVTQLDGATGLTYAASATSGAWTSSALNATNISIPMSTLYLPAVLNCDMRAVLTVEVYFSASVLSVGGYMGVSLYGAGGSPVGSTARQMSSIIQNTAGVDVWKASAMTSFGANYVSAPTAWGLQSYGNGFANSFAGTYAAGWPARYTQHMNAQMSGFNGVRDPEARCAIYWSPATTAATMTATVERIRFTAYQPQAAA